MHVVHELENLIHFPELKKKKQKNTTVQTEKDIFKGHNEVLEVSVYLTYLR